MTFKACFFAILLFAASLPAFAQNKLSIAFSVTGKVVNHTDKKPVPGASVFLGNATIGSETGNDGGFTLQNVKPGNYTLIISIIGYDIYTQPLVITGSSVTLPVIELNPGTVTLNEVKIQASAKKNAYSDWVHDTFIKEFFGPSDLAADCKILNPEVLNLHYDESTNTITASSTDFLLIENNALGYKIKYRLTDFEYTANAQADKSIHYEGSVFFTEMKGSPAQERRWKQNREDLYANSSAHFLRALLNDQLEEEGFRAFRLATVPTPGRSSLDVIQANISRLEHSHTHPDSLRYWKKELAMPAMIQQLMLTPLTKADLVTTTNQPGIFAMGNHGDPIFLMYDKNRRFANIKQLADLNNLNYLIEKTGNKEFTLLSFVTPFTLFDSNGGIVNPNSLEFKGAWVVNRVANLLPIDYEGEAAKNISSEFKNDTVLKATVTALNNYAIANPVEKAYLHLDRAYYAPGDTIWFKAYTVIGQHQLSDLSGVLYTELMNNKDSVISRHILKLLSGLGRGDFDLPLTLKPGSYRVRAYTNYMRNAGPDYYYIQNIKIAGVQQKPISVSQNIQAKPDVQFFPEGGELVDGLRSRVAVKAVNQNGLGQDIKGTITDDAGNKVTDFVTQHLGMGAFELQPEAGKKYKANITCADGSTFSISLPAALEKGFTMAINNSNADSVYIKIAANSKLFKEDKNAVFYVLAQSGGKVCYTAGAKLATADFTTQIAKIRFPSGITQFTLFSQTGEPLSERVIFIKNDDTLKLGLSSPSRVYSARQKVSIAISTDNGKQPAIGSFSVSVINESRVPVNENAETTILNNLLLTSDLKGYIEQPNYYFINNNSKTMADLDLLMLTQGYRRFEWKQVLDTAHTALRYQPEASLFISGSITTPSGKPVPNGSVALVATRENFFTDTTADAKGNFTFNGLSLPDSAKIILRARKQNNGGNVTINIKPADYAAIKKYGVNLDTATALTPAMINSIADYRGRLKQYELINGIQLKEVKIKSTHVPKPDLSFSANLNGPGNADQVIMGDALSGCIDLADCLNGKIFGVRIKSGNAYNNRQAARFGSVSAGGGKGSGGGAQDAPPLTIILDGLIMHTSLNEINASDIYSIEVLRSGGYSAIYGSEAFSGALVITTKRGNEKKNIVSVAAAGLITYPLRGYYITRSFYSPQYSTPKNDALQTTDSRSTIYWEPDIITDKDGKASFEYYNADTKGTYRVVVEGIDADGNIGRQVYRYEVK